MLVSLACTLVVSSWCPNLGDEPRIVDLKVEQAIVYQSGLVMLTRSAPVQKGHGRYRITVVPEAAEGSLWYGISDGATVGDVITRLRFAPRVEKILLRTPAQLLAANVGKKVQFVLPAAKKEHLEGMLEYVRPANEQQAGLRLSNGMLRVFNPFQVSELDTRGLSTIVEVNTRIPERTMEIEIDAEKDTALWVLSMERGAAWAGSYAVETQADNQATFLYKLQIALGGLRFTDTDTRLLAGTPRLPSTIRTDLGSGAASFAALFGQTGRQPDIFNLVRDPYDEIQKVLQERQRLIAEATFAQYQYGYPGGMGGGGFGGGGLGGGMDFISYDPTSNSIVNRPDFEKSSYRPNSEAPEPLLDLISYPMGKLSLEPGDRMSRVQLKSSMPCEPVVRWNLGFRGDGGYVGSIGRFLRIPNKSALFWAPGPCLVSHLGTPIALSQMPLTPPKENAYVKVDEAESILHTRSIREISRKPMPGYVNRWEITAELTYLLGNTTAQEIEFEVAQDVEGTIQSAEGASTKAINPFSVPNPQNRAEWRFKLKPGETKEFKLTYSHKQI